ncbi:ABC transporter substrate-binding protein [Mycolicibacterium litorale]|uniref:ABC transporter substrate-binding protein n=1 Tax=Mycolicibacterium litorale TaxID=758802 RepID=UPI003CF82305
MASRIEPASSATAWDGRAFCVQVLPGGEPGLAELGRWGGVPDGLRRIAAAALSEGLRYCEFYWRAEPSAPLCAVRIELIADGKAEFALLAGELVDALPHDVSRRELDVLTLITTGAGNNEIADILHLSPRTVTTHVDSLMRKLQVRSRTAAATRAVDEGLLGVPIPGASGALGGTRLGRVLSASSAQATRPRSTVRRLHRRPLVIGAALPSSGLGASDAEEMAKGLRLAQAEINAAGGIRGRTVQIEVADLDIDDRASTRRAIAMLADREVDVLTSGYVAHQDVAHDEAATTGIPYLHAATSGVMERRVRDDPARYARILQVCPSDIHYAPAFVRFVDRLTRRRLLPAQSSVLVCIQQSSWELIDFGTSQAQVLADQRGWELVVIDVSGAEDWAKATERALEHSPAAVFVGSYFLDHHVSVVESVRKARAGCLLYSIYAPSVPAFRERLGSAADGVVWATTTGTYSDAVATGFATRYTHKFGSTPGRSHAGLAYDRAHLIAQAWSRADNFRDFAQVSRHLRSATYRGVNGAYSFHPVTGVAAGFDDTGGDPSLAQAHVVYQIQGGRQEIIAPRPYTTARFRVPDWITDATSSQSGRVTPR